ncbi:BglG family transcription antiterminator [Enterococcus olivae]
MEEKYLKILTEILSNPSITRKEVEKKLNLSRDQIRYAIAKINEFLIENELPSIQRKKDGGFIIDPSVSSLFSEKNKLPNKNVFYSQEERITILALLLFNESLDLSLEYFSYELNVSKNTILRDLSKLKKRLKTFTLEITYSRIQGYSLSGNELLIRDFIKETLFKIIKMTKGLQLLSEFSGIKISEIQRVESKLKKIERELEINFSDEQYQILPFFLIILFKRISNGKIVKKRRLEDEFDILNLHEVKVIEKLLVLEKYGKRESIYISLQILSSNIVSGDFVSESVTFKLRKVIEKCIENLEVTTSIELKDKETLLNSLMYHLTPAYYRMKYLINKKNDLYESEFFDNVITQYNFLNSIIKNCFKPLEEFLEVPLPEIEIMYISLIVGSKILPQGKSEFPKIKTAIVICPKGVTYSQLMLTQLMDLFPEVYFYEPVSHRAFQESRLKVDIIFSIGHFHSYENCFVVHATMSNHEKQQLRSNVFKKIFGVDDQLNIVEKIMNIISDYVPINKNDEIRTQILQVLGKNQLAELPEASRETISAMRLVDFLSLNRIFIVDNVKDYQEAIRLAAKPLLKDGSITKGYIKKVIESHDFSDPYTILGERVAIPHATPKEGVKKIAISMLLVKEGVNFSNEQQVNVVFLLAPIDRKQHNQAILDILTVAENNELINLLLLENRKTDILRLLAENIT